MALVLPFSAWFWLNELWLQVWDFKGEIVNFIGQCEAPCFCFLGFFSLGVADAVCTKHKGDGSQISIIPTAEKCQVWEAGMAGEVLQS